MANKDQKILKPKMDKFPILNERLYLRSPRSVTFLRAMYCERY